MPFTAFPRTPPAAQRPTPGDHIELAKRLGRDRELDIGGFKAIDHRDVNRLLKPGMRKGRDEGVGYHETECNAAPVRIRIAGPDPTTQHPGMTPLVKLRVTKEKIEPTGTVENVGTNITKNHLTLLPSHLTTIRRWTALSDDLARTLVSDAVAGGVPRDATILSFNLRPMWPAPKGWAGEALRSDPHPTRVAFTSAMLAAHEDTIKDSIVRHMPPRMLEAYQNGFVTIRFYSDVETGEHLGAHYRNLLGVPGPHNNYDRTYTDRPHAGYPGQWGKLVVVVSNTAT